MAGISLYEKCLQMAQKTENLINIILLEIAKFLYDEDINCELSLIRLTEPEDSRVVSYSYERSNNTKIYANISIFNGEIRTETVRIPLASPTAFDELLYFIKNGVTMTGER
jgi:hypothetical protein